ncbi:MAG: hypothetical protein JRI71_04960 [Deltaproteobacteria bacterium]|nr:hypothetical protein [Deltaproteobacteria bacterium]MBW2076890.1 hypothetical protein [Deltaproteobacteria bacterium]
MGRREELLSMDFPSQPPRSCSPPSELVDGLGGKPLEALCSKDYFVVFASEGDIRGLHPDIEMLKTLDLRGVAGSYSVQIMGIG